MKAEPSQDLSLPCGGFHIMGRKTCGHVTLMGAYMARAIPSREEATAYCTICKRHYPSEEFELVDNLTTTRGEHVP